MKRNISISLLGLLCLTACSVAGTGDFTVIAPAGFWSGLLHGFIVWFAFFFKLLGVHLTIYEAANTGLWYDFGFLLGIGMSAGGSASTVSRRRKHSEDKD